MNAHVIFAEGLAAYIFGIENAAMKKVEDKVRKLSPFESSKDLHKIYYTELNNRCDNIIDSVLSYIGNDERMTDTIKQYRDGLITSYDFLCSVTDKLADNNNSDIKLAEPTPYTE